MERILWIFCVSALLWACVGCGGSDPIKVANKWKQCLVKGDVKGAKSCCVEDNDMSMYITMSASMMPSEVKAKLKAESYDVVEFNNDKTMAVVSCSKEDSYLDVINLTKKGDKWFVESLNRSDE